MHRLYICFTIFLLITLSCSTENTDTQFFGTKNIDHHGIANDFMTKIEKEEYESCYDLLSENYRADINPEDFKFRMKMLNDLSGGEEFYHYNTSFIGKTAKEGLAMINGGKVAKNIMPSYHFTLKSASDKDFKSVQIFIRFENEDSDKISVINYGKHKLLNKKAGMSSLSSNPFIVGNYILLVEHGTEVYADIRGGQLREKLMTISNDSVKSILIKVELEELERFMLENDLATYSLIHVKEEGESLNAPKIRRLSEENGFSVFNHRDKEFKSKSIKKSEVFIKKYQEGNWNPIEE